MSSSSRKSELYRLLLHPLMTVAVSASAVLAALFVAATFAGVPGPRMVTVIGVVLAPIVEAAVGNLLYRERAGIGNRIRELIIYLLIFYVVFSLGREGGMVARFRPAATQLLPLLAIAFTWYSAFSMHNRLRGREALLKTFYGKQGDELRRALIDRQHDMALTVRELRHVRGSILSMFFFVAILAGVTASGVFLDSRLPVASVGFILLVINGIAATLSIGGVNGFIEEYAAHGNGLRVPFRFHRRRLITAAVLVLVVVGLAFGLSRHKSLLSLDPILAFFRWIASLFDRKRELTPPPLFGNTSEPLRNPEFFQLLEPGEPVLPPLWFRLLAELLRRLAIAVAAAVASILIFGPLFSPAFRAGLRQIKPRRVAKEAWRRFLRQLRILARWVRARNVLRRRQESLPTATAPVSAAGTPAEWRPSFAKRRQMDRVVSVFASVTRWGATHGLPYRRSDAAWDYLSRVANLYSDRYTDLQTCREVFWEARYSRRTLPLARMREYVRAARRITGSG